MITKNKILYSIIMLILFSKIILSQCSDSRYYIQTPRGSDVPDTYLTCEINDDDRAYIDSTFKILYPNAIQIILPGEEYSSSNEYNCHGYAWRYVDNGQKIWIGYSQAGSEEVFWNDESYEPVSESVCTKISYTGDHSAIPSGTTDYYYSKWRYYPLMYHRKDYTPGYGTANQFFRRSVDVPEDQSSISAAVSAAVSGQTIEVSGSQSISNNTSLASGVTINFLSGSSLNFNNYGIYGGTIVLHPNANVNGVYYNGGFYHVQTAVNNASSGQTISLLSRTYNTGITFSSKNNVDLSGNGTSSSAINGTISINSSQYVDISDLKAYKISVSGGLNNFTDNVILENPGTDVLLIYNCPSMTLQNSSLNNSYEIGAYVNNSLGSFEYCNVEGHSDALYFYGNSNFNVDYSYLCGNNPHDIWAQSPAYAHAHNCTYSSSPQYSCYGNVQWLGTVDICMAKSSASNFTSETVEQKSNNEFLAIDSVLTKLRGRVTEKIKTNKYNVNEFADEYQVVINDLKNLTKKYPTDELVKTTVFRIAQCYQQLGRTNELKSYVEELLKDKNVETFYPYIERHLVPVFVEQKDYNNAIATAESVKKKSLDDEYLFCEMLYEEGLIYKYNLGNFDEANKIFNDIVANHPKNIMANFAGSELGIKVDSGKEEANPEKESNIEKTNNLEVASYPNPFNPTTTISYSIPADGIVTVKVFDMLGREVRTLVSDYKNSGSYNVIWDSKDSFGSEVSSGIYFYNIKFMDNSITKKMLLVR